MIEESSSFKSKGGLSRLGGALRYSAQGLGAAFRYEAAFRQELAVVAVLLPLAIWIADDVVEAVLLVGPLFLILIVELLNSAIEAIADSVTLKPHPLIGRAKDFGSAAVMISIVLTALIWLAVIASHLKVD